MARASEQLTKGQVYTRADLRALFGITDATINNGVFQPRDVSSVWLFVTKSKTSDRTPYVDLLDGPNLQWQGQMEGRTDLKIIEHARDGNELLVFYRNRRDEHPGAGFRYEGQFEYVSHSGSKPTSFVLQRTQDRSLSFPAARQADEAGFSPSSAEDGRERILRAITQRRGQRAFRSALIDAYGARCAITGCGVLAILEAAHIFPYRGPETNHVSNGLLLRADLHTLFDCGLIAIDPPSLTVIVSPELRDSEYGNMHGAQLREVREGALGPNPEALSLHRAESGL